MLRSDQFTRTDNTFVAEASELGWPPGRFERFFILRIGDAEASFELREPLIVNGETGGWMYSSLCGRFKATVFND